MSCLKLLAVGDISLRTKNNKHPFEAAGLFQSHDILFGNADLSVNKTIKYLAEKIYRQTKNSLIVNVLLFIPNKISEINGRGVQLIVIARNIA